MNNAAFVLTNLLLASSANAIGAAAFSPASLFAASEPGGWYDPSDLTTLFQDAAGTTPVTAVEQPVGLVLDKSRGLVLGSELVSNAADREFSSDTGFWTKTIGVTISGGQCVYTSVSSLGGIYRNAFVTAGTYYEITFTISSITAGAIRLYVGGNRTGNITTAGTYTERIAAGSVDTYLIFENFGTTTLTLDNVSVKPVSGSHLSQSTAAARPVLSARVNLLTYTEQFDNAYWARTGLNAFGSGSVANTTATTDPLGGNTAEYLQENSATGQHLLGLSTAFSVLTTATPYTASAYFKAAERSRCEIAFYYNSGTFPAVWITANLTDGTFTTNSQSGAVVVSGSVTAVGNGWYRVAITGYTNAAATSTHQIQLKICDNSGNQSYAGNGTSGIYIWGADLRPANAGVGLPAYQRVGAAVTGTSGTISPPVAGVTGVPDYDSGPEWPRYLRFDGTDDFLQSSTITPGSVDKAQVFAGVRKLSDAAGSSLAESSSDPASNSGVFILDGSGPTNRYSFSSKGTTFASAVTTSASFDAPHTAVLSGIGDISGDSSILRVNSSQVAQIATDQGTGNFLAHPLYVGRRGGSTRPFNGHLYQLLVRFSATNLDAATITATETWVNQRTKAF